MSEIPNSSISAGSPVMLDISPVTGAPETTSLEGFSAALKTQAEGHVVAEGGKALPEGGVQHLQSRQLQGGTRIKVSGDEPSDEGLAQFALSQGMDPRAILLLKGAEAGSLKPNVAALTSTAGPAGPYKIMTPRDANEMAASITRAAQPSSLLVTAMETHALLDQSALQQGNPKEPSTDDAEELQAQTMGADSGSDESVLSDGHLLAAHTMLAGGEMNRAAQKLELSMHDSGAQSVKVNVVAKQDRTLVAAGQDRNLTGGVDAQASVAKLPPETQSVIPNAAALGLTTKAVKPLETTPKVKLETAVKGPSGMISSAPASTQGSSGDTKDILAQLHVRAATSPGGTSAGVSGHQFKSAVAQDVLAKNSQRKNPDDSAGKVTVAKLDEGLVERLSANSERTAVIKMPPINLASAVAEQGMINLGSSATAPVNPASAMSAPVITAPMTLEGSPVGTSSQHISADGSVEDPARELLRRQDVQSQLSQRLSQALGQRLSAQIERGSWRVEMDLHPASMGRIEVQLEMRNGELEANFLSSNPATRELLQESMPRLREMFEQFGTNSAYLGLGAGNRGQSDGNSASSNGDPDAQGSGDDVPSTNMARKPVSDDGLDVLV